MARISEAPEGGKFRCKASAGLAGVAGAWGDGDLLGVLVDANGELALGGLGTTEGIIWTPEGRKDSSKANYKQVQGGKFYTVLFRGILQDMEIGTSPTFGDGDKVYSAAAGDVTAATAVGAIFLGTIIDDWSKPAGVGLMMVINVMGKPVG